VTQTRLKLPSWLARPAVWVGGLLLAGFLLRLASAHLHWNWFDAQFPSTWGGSKIDLSQDGTQYIQQADPGTWNSLPFRDWDERPFFRPPLASYYFVALFRLFHFDRLAVSAVQSLVALAAYLLAYLLAARLLGRRIGLCTLALLAVHPVLMFEDTSFEDSVPGMLLVSATMLAALWAGRGPSSRWFLPGLAAGLAMLARPNLALLAGGLLLLALFQARTARFRRLVAFSLPVAFLVLPVALHNYEASGRLVPICDTTGQNLYWGNNPFPDHRQSVQGYWDIREVDFGSPGMILVNGLRERSGASASDSAYLAGAVAFVTSEPRRALLGLVEKAWRHLSNHEIPRNRDFHRLRATNLFWRTPLPPFSIVLGLALLGLRGMDRRQAFLLLLPWLAVFVSEVLFFNASRYRALALPFLIPPACMGVANLVMPLLRERRLRPLIAGLGVLVPFFLLGQTAVAEKERTGDLAVDHFKAAMLESYAAADGDWRRFSDERFRRNLQEARRLDPDNLDAFSVEQKMLIRDGRSAEVRDNIRARRERCRPGEWLCQEVCDYLALRAAAQP